MSIPKTPIVGNPGGQVPLVHVRNITTGVDLYELNANTISKYPASTTKLMTVALVIDYKNSVLNTETVTMTNTDISQPIAGLTLDLAGFQSGDVVKWIDIIYAMMLPSSTEAARCAARTIGDEVYVAAGSTGTQGEARFVELMNAKATTLGMTDTVYVDPFGGSRTDVDRNTITARDMSRICIAAMANSTVAIVANAVTRDIVITGGRSTTLTVSNYNRFINGPTLNQSGVKDTNVVGGKNGVWTSNGSHYTLTQIWNAPNGNQIVFSIVDSVSLYAMMLDHRGLMYKILVDFPALLGTTQPAMDIHWTNVKVLIGADGSIVDESTAAKTITVTSVTVGDPVVASSGGMLFNAASDMIAITHDSDLAVGLADMTHELFYAGSDSTPDGEYVFLAKASASNLEWAIDENGGSIQSFVSTNGAGFNPTLILDLNAHSARDTFHNGAPRHIAMVKSGSSWNVYINGEKIGNTLSFASSFAGTGRLTIGFDGSSAAPIGNIDELRFTNGVARYTSDMHTIEGRKFARTDVPPPPPISTHKSNIPGSYRGIY